MKRKWLATGLMLGALNVATIAPSHSLIYAWPAFVAGTPMSAHVGGIMYFMSIGSGVVGGILRSIDGTSSNSYKANSAIGYVGVAFSGIASCAALGAGIALEADNSVELPVLNLPKVTSEQVDQFLKSELAQSLNVKKEDFTLFNKYRASIAQAIESVYYSQVHSVPSIKMEDNNTDSVYAFQAKAQDFSQSCGLPVEVLNVMQLISTDLLVASGYQVMNVGA